MIVDNPEQIDAALLASEKLCPSWSALLRRQGNAPTLRVACAMTG